MYWTWIYGEKIFNWDIKPKVYFYFEMNRGYNKLRKPFSSQKVKSFNIRKSFTVLQAEKKYRKNWCENFAVSVLDVCLKFIVWTDSWNKFCCDSQGTNCRWKSIFNSSGSNSLKDRTLWKIELFERLNSTKDRTLQKIELFERSNYTKDRALWNSSA